jgi:TonB family protein
MSADAVLAGPRLDVPPLADPARRERLASSLVLAVALHAGLAILLIARGAPDSDALAGLGFNRAGVVLTAEVAELPKPREEVAAVPPEPANPEPARPEPPAPEPPVVAQPPALPPVQPAPPAPPAQETPLPPARAALPEQQAMPAPATRSPGFAVPDMPEPEAPQRHPEIALAPPEHWPDLNEATPDNNDSLEDIQVLIGPPQRAVATRTAPSPATPAPIRVAPVLIKPGNPLAPTSYPTAAIANRLEGDVLLGIELDRNSQIRQIRVVRSSGHATLDAAATQAARTWKLRVHTEDYSGPGRILSIYIEAPVSFRLN